MLNHADIADVPLHSVLRGWAHGDLSGRNIVLPTNPLGPEDFVLIDIDRCRDAQPLARDPMHLLVALAIDRFRSPGQPPGEPADLARALLAAVTPDRRPVTTDFGRVAAGLSQGAAALACRLGAGEQWVAQAQVCLVAAALMHLGRDLRLGSRNDVVKRWCLDLASQVARDFLTMHGPADGDRSCVATGDDGLAVPAVLALPMPQDQLRLVVEGAGLTESLMSALQVAVCGLPVDLVGLSGRRTVGRDCDRLLTTADAVLLVGPPSPQAVQTLGALPGPEDPRYRPVLLLCAAHDKGLTRAERFDVVRADHAGVISDGEEWERLCDRVRAIASPQYNLNRCAALRDYAHRLEVHTKATPSHKRYLDDRRYFEARTAAERDRLDCRRPWSRALPSLGPVGALSARADRPPPLPKLGRIDREPDLATLLKMLRKGGDSVALVGADGIGLTAIVRALFDHIDAGSGGVPFVEGTYISLQQAHPLTADTILASLARLVGDENSRQTLLTLVRQRDETWSDKLDAVTKALPGAVLLAIDDIERALDSTGRLADEAIRSLLAALAHPSSEIKVLLVGTQVPRTPPVRECEVTAGLVENDSWRMLQAIDDTDTLVLGSVIPAAQCGIANFTQGYPRLLELFAATVRSSPWHRSAEMLARVVTHKPDQAPSATLWDRLLPELDRLELRVLVALAIYDRRVPAGAVDAILAPFVPGLDSAVILAELEHRKLITRVDDRYSLPREGDAEHLLSILEPGDVQDAGGRRPPMTVLALRHLAANYYYEQTRYGQPTRLEDLGDWLAEIEMRVLACDRDRAIHRMNELDKQCLDKRGASALLSQWRGLLREHPSDVSLMLENGSRLANAYLQQGDPESAIAVLDGVLPVANERRIPVSFAKLSVQLGDALLMGGDADAAMDEYQEALDTPIRRQDARLRIHASALTGLMRCHIQHGDLSLAKDLLASPELVLLGADEDARELRAGLLISEATLEVYQGKIRSGRAILAAAERICSPDLTLALGRVREAQAVAGLDVGQIAEALRSASLAWREGSHSNNRSLQRESAIAMAQAHLCTGRIAEALEQSRRAIQLAQQSRSPAAHLTHGICLLRDSNPQASEAFEIARDRAESVLVADPRNWELHDTAGLALVGLALTRVELRRRRLDEAVRHFVQARTCLDMEVSVNRVYRLFTSLTWNQPPGEKDLDRVLASALGDYGHPPEETWSRDERV